MNNVRINTHSFIDNVLYGYVCSLCKYVQLSKNNVIKHLQSEHQQINQIDENIVEVVLLKAELAKQCVSDVSQIDDMDDDVILISDTTAEDSIIDLTLSDGE